MNKSDAIQLLDAASHEKMSGKGRVRNMVKVLTRNGLTQEEALEVITYVWNEDPKKVADMLKPGKDRLTTQTGSGRL